MRYSGMTGIVVVGLIAVEACSPAPRSACEAAFAEAASVSEFQDTHQDLFPAYSACRSLDEWRAADRAYPAAIDGVDPVRYAMTVCASNQATLGSTPICRAANEPTPTATEGLERSSNTGLLGAPVPTGSRLIETTAGDVAAGRDPSERYTIPASATEIASFYDREMREDGWAKDGASMGTALFFEKGPLVLGVLINSAGGTFTLMGS